ncbi:MAG TPA: hypothetical protein VF733_05050 [Candidatus Saccharimonadales bacterium]
MSIVSNSDFIERRNAIKPTLESVGIETQAILIGGAGLALYGINTSRGIPEQPISAGGFLHRFDVDVILPEDEFKIFRDRCRQLRGADVGFGIGNDMRIELEASEEGLHPLHALMVDSEMLENERIDVIDGVRALSPGAIAKSKNHRGEVRDTVGLILGHEDAYHQGVVAVVDTAWREQVGVALARTRKLQSNDPQRLQVIMKDFLTPVRFAELVYIDFDDPAFEGM